MSELTYITSARCGWCRKADPIIEELQNSGIEITILDVTVEEEKNRANEIKSKHGKNCGTPFFIDAETGNSVCGFSEEGIRKWVTGEAWTPPPQKKVEPNRGDSEKLEILTDGSEKISLEKDAKIEIVDNEEKWWKEIAYLRSLNKVQKGFITRLWTWISPGQQHKHMTTHSKEYIVAKSGDQFLGYARCIDGDIGICVYPVVQGRGIASMLLEELLRRFPNAHARVKVDNLASKKLFEKFGFVVVDTVEVDCLHGIVFEKVLVMNRGQSTN